MDKGFKVFVELDNKNSIIKIYSNLFEIPSTIAIEIDKGEGELYAHAQSQYLEKSVFDTKNRPNFKYVEGTLSELSEEEKERFYPLQKPQKTEVETLQEQVAMLNETIDIILFDVIPDVAYNNNVNAIFNI
ncbi:MAG: hypothetical protein RR923_02940 [Bacilli bacterium]